MGTSGARLFAMFGVLMKKSGSGDCVRKTGAMSLVAGRASRETSVRKAASLPASEEESGAV